MFERLEVLPADRAFNWIDHLLIDDLIYISENEEAVAKLRGQWDKLYERVNYDKLNESVSSDYYDGKEEKPEDFIPGNYVVPTEEGYPGLREAPLG